MKRVFLLTALAVGSIGISNAQYKPAAGERTLEVNFAPLGGTPVSIGGIKYRSFSSETTAFRVGVFLGFSNTTKVTQDENSQTQMLELKEKNGSTTISLQPGIEKHFSSSNIFDVYAAGDLYLGFGRDKSVNSQTNTDGDVTSTTQTTPYTIVGLGGVIGVNVFVLDLPVSVGVEYGLSAFWQLGNRTKVEVETPDESYEYFTVANDPFSLQGQAYTSLKQKYMTMNTNDQVRIVANIYFN